MATNEDEFTEITCSNPEAIGPGGKRLLEIVNDPQLRPLLVNIFSHAVRDGFKMGLRWGFGLGAAATAIVVAIFF